MFLNWHLACVSMSILLAAGRQHRTKHHRSRETTPSVTTTTTSASGTASIAPIHEDDSKTSAANNTTDSVSNLSTTTSRSSNDTTSPLLSNRTTSAGTGTAGLTSDFGDNGLPPGAPGIPTNIAQITTYDVSLPAFPIAYSDSEKDSQTQAGTDLAATLTSVFNQHLNTSGNSTPGSYTVKPGVYRISKEITIPNVSNFKLTMSEVELVTTSTNGHFRINDATDLEIAGPLYLDADPIPESQGFIVATDSSKGSIDVQTMPGYSKPNLGSRLKCFTKDGIMQRHYQDVIKTVDDLGNGTVFRVTIDPASFENFPCLQTVGNYFTSQGDKTTGSGGVNFQGTGDLYWHEVYHYYSGLTFGQNIQGTLRLDRWMGQRRNGTNRLGAGGWILAAFDGGSLDMTNSEISHNYDDLTDLNGYFGSAMAGPSPNQVYLRASHLLVGRTFKFYDATDLTLLGTSSITQINTETVTDDAIKTKYNALEKAASTGINDADNPIALVTLSPPPTPGASGLYLASDQQSQPKLFSIRNTYLHDSLAAGIQLRAADRLVATGNVIERAAINCATAGFSAYWLEGGVPGSVDFSDNYCIDSPYSVGMTGPAIAVAPEKWQLQHTVNMAVMANVTVNDNTIVNPQLGGIMVTVSDGVSVKGNAVWNLASVRPPGVDEVAYGISIQSSRNVVVEGNTVHVTNASAGFDGRNLIVGNNQTRMETVRVGGGNAVFGGGGNGSGNAAATAAGKNGSSITLLDTTGY